MLNNILTFNRTQAIASHSYTVAKHGCLGAIQLGADFRPVFEQACIYTIAAGIETRKFYQRHLHQHVESAFYAIVFFSLIALTCAASTILTFYRVVAPIVQRQAAIQIADFKNFHAAVSGQQLTGIGSNYVAIHR